MSTTTLRPFIDFFPAYLVLDGMMNDSDAFSIYIAYRDTFAVRGAKRIKLVHQRSTIERSVSIAASRDSSTNRTSSKKTGMKSRLNGSKSQRSSQKASAGNNKSTLLDANKLPMAQLFLEPRRSSADHLTKTAHKMDWTPDRVDDGDAPMLPSPRKGSCTAHGDLKRGRINSKNLLSRPKAHAGIDAPPGLKTPANERQRNKAALASIPFSTTKKGTHAENRLRPMYTDLELRRVKRTHSDPVLREDSCHKTPELANPPPYIRTPSQRSAWTLQSLPTLLEARYRPIWRWSCSDLPVPAGLPATAKQSSASKSRNGPLSGYVMPCKRSTLCRMTRKASAMIDLTAWPKVPELGRTKSTVQDIDVPIECLGLLANPPKDFLRGLESRKLDELRRKSQMSPKPPNPGIIECDLKKVLDRRNEWETMVSGIENLEEHVHLELFPRNLRYFPTHKLHDLLVLLRDMVIEEQQWSHRYVEATGKIERQLAPLPNKLDVRFRAVIRKLENTDVAGIDRRKAIEWVRYGYPYLSQLRAKNFETEEEIGLGTYAWRVLSSTGRSALLDCHGWPLKRAEFNKLEAIGSSWTEILELAVCPERRKGDSVDGKYRLVTEKLRRMLKRRRGA